MNIRSIALFLACATGLSVFSVPARADDTPPTGSPRDVDVDLNHSTGNPLSTVFRVSVGGDRAFIYERPTVQRDLKFVVDQCGFQYIRFHGLLDDEMKVVTAEPDGSVAYHWDNIDKVYDLLLKSGIKPFVELGFMPTPLASGAYRVFFYKGNTTPPKSYEAWGKFVTALVQHLTSRYGPDQVKSWYFEVWNEPNLKMFWHGDRAGYFHLYDVTSRAIKGVNPDYRVGGPATAGIGLAWVPEFLAACHQNQSPVDFVTTHLYGVTTGFLDEHGNAQLVLDPHPGAIIDALPNLLNAIHDSPTPTLPLFITEWSASYSARDPVHDSYLSAPYILSRLKLVPAGVAGMSYWTFSDQFEENGPVPSPFHGGFGLLNAQGLRKPAFYAYKFLNTLAPDELVCDDPDAIATRTSAGGVKVLFWNYTPPHQDRPNQTFYTRDWPAPALARTQLQVQHLAPGQYTLNVFRVGYRHNDVYTAYVDLGKPHGLKGNPGLLDDADYQKLNAASDGKPQTTTTVQVSQDGRYALQLPMNQNDVYFVTLDPGAAAAH